MVSMFRRNLIIGNINNESELIILTYTTTKDNQKISLLYDQSIFNGLVNKCRILETNEEVSNYQYTFPSKGEHKVQIEWKKNITNFNSCFRYCSELTNIPDNLFKENISATDFSYCFQYCSGLISIPSNLFSNNTNVKNLGGCFYGCSKLTDVPSGIFKNNTKVDDFSYCFYGCSKLTSIPEKLFENNINISNFSFCFHYCSELEGYTPKDSVGELWERAGKPGYPTSINGDSCFFSCTKLSNYSLIPSNWK